MNNYNYNIDEEIALLEKYNLNPTELFVVKCLLLYQEGYQEEYLVRFLKIDEKFRGDFKSIIESLQNKGIILKSYKIPKKGETFEPNEIPISKLFTKNIYRASGEMGIELLETYPMFGYINNYPVSLRGVSKKFDSIEDFCRFYGKVIGWNPELHKQILDLIKWEKDSNVNFINMNIANFVIDKKWNELKALKEGKLANINYDTIKSL